MSTATVLAGATRRTWTRLTAGPGTASADQPSAALSLRWSVAPCSGLALVLVRVRAGRSPGQWSASRPAETSGPDAAVAVLRLPVEVWAAPAVVDFRAELVDAGGRTYRLSAAEPVFWNGTDTSVRLRIGAVFLGGRVTPCVEEVDVRFTR